METSFPTSDCFTFSAPVVAATASTLSAVVSVQSVPQCVGQTAAPASGLSGGVIAGIAVGAAVLVAASLVVSIVIYRATQDGRDRKATIALQTNFRDGVFRGDYHPM